MVLLQDYLPKQNKATFYKFYYGRNGECPLPVLSCATPADCFEMAFEAIRISTQHMVPVILLSDGYIANGAEPWKFPIASELPDIKIQHKNKLDEGEESFLPYKRNENLVRSWCVPGTPGFEHRIGGLEKQDNTGNVSYDSENHKKMVLLRQAKVDKIEDFIPLQTIDTGTDSGKVLVIGWGSTYGSIKSSVLELLQQNYSISFTHLKYLRPFPKNLGDILKKFDTIIIPEINNGQLIRIIRDKYLVNAIGYHKIMGTPIYKDELVGFFKKYLV